MLVIDSLEASSSPVHRRFVFLGDRIELGEGRLENDGVLIDRLVRIDFCCRGSDTLHHRINDTLVKVLPDKHVIDLTKSLLMGFLIQDLHHSVSRVVYLVDCKVHLCDLKL